MFDDEDDSDQVGYGRPPKHSRYKKGQSGNPSGRKRRHGYEDEVNPIRAFMLEEKIVKVAGKRVKMPAFEVIMMSMINKAMTRDHRTGMFLIQQSGGFKGIRREYKQRKSLADHAYIEAVWRAARDWGREDDRSGDDHKKSDQDRDQN